jgi:hypothetical protein
MDLPFLFSQNRILRAFDLTLNLKIRYGADIHTVSVKLRYLGFSQYIGSCRHLCFRQDIAYFI